MPACPSGLAGTELLEHARVIARVALGGARLLSRTQQPQFPALSLTCGKPYPRHSRIVDSMFSIFSAG
jgi:hypothetical protein